MKRNTLKSLKVMYNNINGIKSKIQSLERIIEEEKPAIIGITESKLDEHESLKLEGYEVKRVDRKSGAGGVMIAYKKCLKNMVVVVREEKEMEEMLWIKIDNKKVKLRIGIVYMPQEKDVKVAEIKAIYKKIEEEIEKAKVNKEKVILMGDLNCKIGKVVARNNEEVSKGGKILIAMCEKLDLSILNTETFFEGTWTRISKEKKSVIDYIIVNKEDTTAVTRAMVDELKEMTPYRMDENKQIVYSDHCTMMLETHVFKIKNEDQNRRSINKKGYENIQAKLQQEQISETIKEDNFVETYTKWNDDVMRIVEECSSKRKKSKGWKVDRKLQVAKKMIIKELKAQNLGKEEIRILKVRKNLINEHIEKEHWKKNHKHVCGEVDKIKSEGGIDSTAFWELKQRLEGRREEIAHVMQNESGVIVEEDEEILEVYENFYTKLLETRPGLTELEKESEVVVSIAMKAIELLAECQDNEEIDHETVHKIISSLKTKKAKDMHGWKNEFIKQGGDEMEKSIIKIASIVDKTHIIPKEWDKLKIKSVHKKGSKTLMKNKRGLFITNLVSKVYERVIKERNKGRSKLSPNQTGGTKGKSTIDLTMIVLAIIERNKYLGKATMITFADVEKCFDKIWLEDGLKDLWKSGMTPRDCMALKKMNEVAKATIETPLGPTKEITLSNTVRQGTVNGPSICAATIDTINVGGYNVVTHYGPTLEINIGAYVDDLESAGSSGVANNTIRNCGLMEDRKKVNFNTGVGKSGVLVINESGLGNGAITAKVKNGRFEEVKEHKLLGTWLDKSGRFEINIVKRKQKLRYMISSTRLIANTRTMGKLAMNARLKIMEAVLIQAFLYNSEAFSTLTNKEVTSLESIQATMLRDLLEVPSSTPYLPLLLETGMWTMEGRVDYRKMMLYHHIIHSPDERILKKMILVQKEMNRCGTWYHTITMILRKYQLENVDINVIKKSTWKKMVKSRIQVEMERVVRTGCEKMKKGRTVVNDTYERKEYLTNTNVEESKGITKMRMHMNQFPCNYGNGGVCWLCKEKVDVNTEHYFVCPETRLVKLYWNTKCQDMQSKDSAVLLRASKFLGLVEKKNMVGKLV